MRDATMGPERLAEIKARNGARSPGDWSWERRPFNGLYISAGPRLIAALMKPLSLRTPAEVEADARFIAHAPEDVADLLAYVEMLEALASDRANDSDLAQWAVRQERARCEACVKAALDPDVAFEMIREGYEPQGVTR